jgi:hypothetical protein
MIRTQSLGPRLILAALRCICELTANALHIIVGRLAEPCLQSAVKAQGMKLLRQDTETCICRVTEVARAHCTTAAA